MATAAIIPGNTVISTEGLNALKFDLGGYLVEFRISEAKYRHALKVNFRSDDAQLDEVNPGFYLETEFLKYLARKITPTQLSASANRYTVDRFKAASKYDMIQVRRLKLTPPDYSPFCYIDDFFWPYDPGVSVVENDKIKIPSGVPGVPLKIDLDPVAEDLFHAGITIVKNSSFAGDKSVGALLVAQIAILVNNIIRSIFPLFTGADFEDYINSQKEEWSNGDVFDTPDIAGFNAYFKRINNYYKSAYSNQFLIQQYTGANKVYWLGYVLSEEALKIIPVPDRIKILETIAKGTLYGETSVFVPNAIDEESFALKIANSIQDADADEFLKGLIDNYLSEDKRTLTLFEILYDKINDTGYGGKNLKGMDE